MAVMALLLLLLLLLGAGAAAEQGPRSGTNGAGWGGYGGLAHSKLPHVRDPIREKLVDRGRRKCKVQRFVATARKASRQHARL